MTFIDTMIQSYEFNRSRTVATLDRLGKLPDPQAVLGWRPGAGRAHIAWQAMHIGVTEDIFASERLAPAKAGIFTEIWGRYRGGSTPDESIPELAEIRKVLDESRSSLLDTLSQVTEDELETIPEALKERGLTIRNVLNIISWHESHHQGQMHLTLNLFENQ